MTLTFPGLPVEETFPELKAALTSSNIAILEAPPGAGKTTLVPLALLFEPWLEGKKIILLEPRRLAARLSAKRMASLLGEEVGQTVGYRIRQDKKISPQTRIEVVTEGVLTRQLQNDPELEGIGLVIFDEFHERNLQGDLSLAFCLDSQSALRDDLRLLIMSATLEGQDFQAFLGDIPKITSEGRSFEVETRNFPRPDKFSLVEDVSKVCQQAFREEKGNILAFLPGEREIRQVEERLLSTLGTQDNVIIAPLYGALSQSDQDKAILAPKSPDTRKIVLATTIAETSLTIEGIRVVVDCGFKRVSRFDVSKSMARLETVRISRAAANQRKGRAGRLEAGVCYQLWPQAETQAMALRDEPEILETDLCDFVLELANWGVSNPQDLNLPDQPPTANFQRAQKLLNQLGALDEVGKLTPHGKELHRLSLHPRLSHMILQSLANGEEEAALACEIAACLHDGPLLKGSRSSDLRDSLSLFERGHKHGSLSKGAFMRAKETSKSLKRQLGLLKATPLNAMESGRILALAYPDRIAKLRSKGSGDYLLSSGIGAELSNDDPLFGSDFLVIAHMDGAKARGRIFSALPLEQNELEAAFPHLLIEEDQIGWDDKSQSAVAKQVTRFGSISLKERPLKNIDPEQTKQAICYGIAQKGLHVLPWSGDSEDLCQRIEYLRRFESFPDFSEEGLLESLYDWLGPYLNNITRMDQLKKLDLSQILLSRLSWEEQQLLNELAPSHYLVPSGSSIRLDYSSPEKPALKVKLQEMFGEPQTPKINNGRTALQIHLLSPAARPLQVTEDLASFWQNAYDSVKKEMRGRYPKHPWPDNPIDSIATKKTKRHMG